MKTQRIRQVFNVLSKVYDRFISPSWEFNHRIITENLGFPKGPVLELGVGTGKNLPSYPSSADLWGIDISGGMLEQARQYAARTRASD